MGNNACKWQFAPGANCSNNKANWQALYSFTYNTLVTELTNNVPPILELTNGGNTHWVVVSALQGDGLSDSNYHVTDPNGGAVRSLTYYTQNGWSKGRIAVYTRR
jgi:hypothetical protein